MDQLLEEKYTTTSRGFHYRYYVSEPSSTPSSTEDPVLLLLHGWPDGAALWQYMVPHLQRAGLRILAPDLLGYGGSAKPTAPADYAFDVMAQDMLELLAHARIAASQRVLPVGHDWGAQLAKDLYLRHTQRCAGLVQLSFAYDPPTAGARFELSELNAAMEAAFGYPAFIYWEFFLAPDGPGLMSERVESLWHVLHGDAPDWTKQMFCVRGAMRAWLEADRRDVPLKGFAQDEKFRGEWVAMMKEGGLTAPCCWYRAWNENVQSEVQKTLPRKVEKPYLFVGSDGDPVCRAELVQQPIEEGLLRDSTVKNLSGCGHWIPYERPEDVSEIIVNWLKEGNFV